MSVMAVEGNMITGMIKPEDDPNLVIDIKTILDTAISTEVGSRFYNDPSILAAVDVVSPIQRIIINRYFSNLLYRFRSMIDVEVTDPITCLIDDGTTDTWLDMFKKGVLTFLISENVYSIVQD